MNDALASTLFGNLLKNAYLHNRAGGSIDLLITASHLVITNTGPSPALDTTAVFNRFYRGSNSEGSTGLGLALCKSICSLYGMDIRYDFSGERHVFTLCINIT
jgi:signal transduction histidine kinase